MTEMAVVTDLTVGDYWDQLPEYSQRASELGVSINSAYKAATLYYQQGLKANEVSAISAETLKMAKIAGLDAADATDKMTAALRGFNMELNETSAQRVSDVYSELAAITAADTKEIANAMTKTASIASSAGMEFETTAAFLSQIIETTRESAETAGTAMKTVIARFQELKKDPSEIGEVEGEIVDANKIETALRSVGVSLRDATGQFRDLDDVFLELSSKWDSLDKNTQRYIATIAAGSRQQSRFIAMMSDYARTQELVTSANNSAGASQRQFEKTLEGVEAKLAKLKNAWDEFTMGIMNSDFVKFAIDALTKILEVINKATSAFDGIFGSIVKIAGVLAIFKLGQALFNKMKEPLLEFAQEVVTQMGIVGEKSGKAFAEKFKKAVDEAMETEPKPNAPEKPGPEEGEGVSPQEQEVEKKTAKQWLGEKTGASKIKAGAKALGRMNRGRRAAADVANLEKQREEALANGTSEGLDKIEKKLKKAKEA
jgi:TP901 family phage tail tape measure protein